MIYRVQLPRAERMEVVAWDSRYFRHPPGDRNPSDKIPLGRKVRAHSQFHCFAEAHIPLMLMGQATSSYLGSELMTWANQCYLLLNREQRSLLLTEKGRLAETPRISGRINPLEFFSCEARVGEEPASPNV